MMWAFGQVYMNGKPVIWQTMSDQDVVKYGNTFLNAYYRGRVDTMSLPWGSWADYPKVNIGGKEYAEIGNRYYTEHAVERMTPHGLTTNGRSME